VARLAAWVHVTGADGRNHVFGPDDEVPAWAARTITNPAAWADGATPHTQVDLRDESTPAPVVKPPAKRAPRRKATPNDDAVHGG
jgi:hypothetical protein